MKEEGTKLSEYNLFRDLIIGKDVFIPSWTLYKRILLTGQVALFGMFYAMLQIVLAYMDGLIQFIPYHVLLVVSCFLSLFLLRRTMYNAGRILLLISSLILVSLFAVLDPSDLSVYYFFFVIAIAALTIFGFERITIGISFTVLVIVAFLVIYLGNYELIEPVSEEVAQRTFALNFVTSVLLSVLMVYYMILINYQTIRKLIIKEEDMIQMTNQLSESRNRFELAIKGSSAGIWEWDPMTDALYLSPLLKQILGYSPEDIKEANKESFFHIVHPDDIEMVKAHLEAHLSRKKKFEVELRLRKKDKSYIWVLDTGQAEWDEDGNPVRMVGSMIDISERKNAENEVLEKNELLEKANKELDRFVYSVSHDLKSPLSSVLGLISISEMSEDPEEIRKCIDMMRLRIDQLNNFIEEIIEYARNTRKEIHHDDEVHLSDLVNKILENFEYTDNRKKIQVINDIPPEHIISTDMGRLKIILNNLIGNAIKYHNVDQDQPFIRVSSSMDEEKICITIQDNGPGISKDLQDKVFEMFFRASSTSDGSGLGLYIAREMAENLNGVLALKSEPGKGSLFSLRMPLQKKVLK